MDHLKVQLIGVLPDENTEGFCYTVDAPTNLWVGALCDDGSRMGNHFMAFILNELIEADCFSEGDSVVRAQPERQRTHCHRRTPGPGPVGRGVRRQHPRRPHCHRHGGPMNSLWWGALPVALPGGG